MEEKGNTILKGLEGLAQKEILVRQTLTEAVYQQDEEAIKDFI